MSAANLNVQIKTYSRDFYLITIVWKSMGLGITEKREANPTEYSSHWNFIPLFRLFKHAG